MVERIIFDLDDTLLNTGERYTRQLEQFAGKVKKQFQNGVTRSDVLSRQQSIDQEAIEELGMDKQRFPESLARTWESFCREYDYPVKKLHLDECLRIGWKVYDDVPEPLDGMESTIESLHGEYELILYTMGDPGIQLEKIRHHRLETWFSEIHVVPSKDRSTLEPLVRPIPPEYVAIVGDSLRGEVRPGIEMGLLSVHRETPNQWHYHVVDIEGEYHSIRELPELLEVLNGNKRGV